LWNWISWICVQKQILMNLDSAEKKQHKIRKIAAASTQHICIFIE